MMSSGLHQETRDKSLFSITATFSMLKLSGDCTGYLIEAGVAIMTHR
jgi:hypothetical protein